MEKKARLTALFGKKLVDSAADGKLHQVRKILEHSARQVDLDHVSEDGDTALQAACRNGHDEVVTFLLVEGARPDTPLWAPTSRSAICHAVAFGGDDDTRVAMRMVKALSTTTSRSMLRALRRETRRRYTRRAGVGTKSWCSCPSRRVARRRVVDTMDEGASSGYGNWRVHRHARACRNARRTRRHGLHEDRRRWGRRRRQRRPTSTLRCRRPSASACSAASLCRSLSAHARLT